ncbi:MAG: alpha/beta fold hydrolase [Burkholderiaceae bacterium]|jgi:magnesium chelatase accessory protein|nr:alpha/beta fold hydrolase [Burkholderiaceae bacterium]
MDWALEGRNWPHHQHSRFVSSGGRRWHVQQWPAPSAHAPQLLLLHGTGASTHSWRHLVPLLAQQAGVVAVDLPGHGFSEAARGDGATLPGMARGVAALLREIGFRPTVLIGHSAGAAIAARMALDQPQGLQSVISLNGALLPLHGLAGQVFSPLAKLLAANRFVPQLFAWRASEPSRVRRLVDGTGSSIDAAGVDLYGRLVRDPAHVAGALAMMAHWDLRELAAALPQLRTPLHLLAADLDKALPPSQSQRAARLVPQASFATLPALGHLAHEEDPQQVYGHIRRLVTAGAADSPTS